MNAGHVSSSSSDHDQDPTSAAQQHVDDVVHTVAVSAKACWLAVSEEEKLQPAHCQALLQTFLSASLFVADKPAGLRCVMLITKKTVLIQSLWPCAGQFDKYIPASCSQAIICSNDGCMLKLAGQTGKHHKCSTLQCTMITLSLFHTKLRVSCDCRGALHGEEGPLQWLVHQVLGAGQRSPRVTAHAALHLAPLFLACPPAALFYQHHIKKLLLFDAKQASSEVCFFELGGTSEHM